MLKNKSHSMAISLPGLYSTLYLNLRVDSLREVEEKKYNGINKHVEFR